MKSTEDITKIIERIDHIASELQLVPLMAAVRAYRDTQRSPLPFTVRYANLPIITAVRRFLKQEASEEGATYEEIKEGLMSGGQGWNMPNFARDLKNSLIRSAKSGVLVRHEGKYQVGSKRPAIELNRHPKRNMSDVDGPEGKE